MLSTTPRTSSLWIRGGHNGVSALYSSIRWNITGSRSLTIRQWMSIQSYAAQREFGPLAMENVKKRFW